MLKPILGLCAALVLAGAGPAPAEAPGDVVVASHPSRDPFAPPNLGLERRAPATPLEAYDLHALTLVAVISDAAVPRAMVEDAAGLGYTITVGTPIGSSGGIVKAIEPNRVLVEETALDFYGDARKRTEMLELRPEGARKSP